MKRAIKFAKIQFNESYFVNESLLSFFQVVIYSKRWNWSNWNKASKTNWAKSI